MCLAAIPIVAVNRRHFTALRSETLSSGEPIMKTLARLVAFGFVSLSTSVLLAQAASPHASHSESKRAQAEQGASDPNVADSRSGGSMAQVQKMMQARMQASDAQLDALLTEMNGATGEKKVEAMAALL